MLWQCQLEKVLKDLGFLPDLQDPAVFLHEEGLMIVTHVDDFLVAGPSRRVKEVMENLQKEFKLTTQNALDGKEHTFLGRSLQWLKPGHVVDLYSG